MNLVRPDGTPVVEVRPVTKPYGSVDRERPRQVILGFANGVPIWSLARSTTAGITTLP